ncbi:hypothetical protein I6A84_43835 [Frankia sp. CNm7]|uniref:Uncharacterized protein n=1 Tax=Frankia nepalensis TaxID=1836974 RepID=A0A937UQ54_9ACTN|nr:hypothetical protein [Frankia nepalensis]MBL7494813.1 hypothetical protein [Frankia nepalensis]MBL7508962.1 hypothetical protein [Frankia nepalensis]MBL7524792.1 hypothetical protein [Frankia nepalensis]MBL7626296.1 hypothetical protein [Frankia nepalensis]
MRIRKRCAPAAIAAAATALIGVAAPADAVEKENYLQSCGPFYTLQTVAKDGSPHQLVTRVCIESYDVPFDYRTKAPLLLLSSSDNVPLAVQEVKLRLAPDGGTVKDLGTVGFKKWTATGIAVEDTSAGPDFALAEFLYWTPLGELKKFSAVSAPDVT